MRDPATAACAPSTEPAPARGAGTGKNVALAAAVSARAHLFPLSGKNVALAEMRATRAHFFPLYAAEVRYAGAAGGASSAGAPNRTSASGSATDPSSRWPFSSRAMIVRPTATAVPFRVWTCSGRPSPGR